MSIIIPLYNRENLIKETLESVIEQTYNNWECIIIDDGSTDESYKVAEEYSKKDDRIVVYRRPESRTKGANVCRNIGLEKAKGDYIQFLDSDDILKSNKLEIQLRTLKNFNSLAIATCKWGSFRTSNYLRVKSKWHSYRNFRQSLKLLYTFGRYNEYMPPIVYLVPKRLCDITGPWSELLKNNQDGEYFSRILINSTQVVYCDSTEAYYRAGDSERLSLLDDTQKIRSGIESWRMIQRHLSAHPRISEIYTRNGIYNIYKQIKETHPEILDEYSEFFEKNLTKKKWYQKLF